MVRCYISWYYIFYQYYTSRVKWKDPMAFNVFGVFVNYFCFNFWGFQVCSLILYLFWNFELSGNLNSLYEFPRGTEVHLPPLIFASTLEVSKFAASSFLKLWIFRQPRSQGGGRGLHQAFILALVLEVSKLAAFQNCP